MLLQKGNTTVVNASEQFLDKKDWKAEDSYGMLMANNWLLHVESL